MPAVIAALLRSPLAERYRLEAIPTYRDSRPVRRLFLFAFSILALTRWCAGSGPRIVHVHMAARGSMYRKAVVVAVAKAMRRKTILHVHAGPGDLDDFIARLGPFRRRVLRGTLDTADLVLSVSASGAGVLGQLTDVKIDVVPNPPPSIVHVEPEAGRQEDRQMVSVLYLGGFADPAKGGAVLVDALSSLLPDRGDVDVRLAGPGTPPPALPERVSWCGFLDEPAKNAALAAADLFVMPSLSEGMPIALLEAMSHGLPIVATRVGAVSEVLSDGVDAVLVDPGDAAQLANALAGLAADPSRRDALGVAARERARCLADDDVYERLDRIYLAVLR